MTIEHHTLSNGFQIVTEHMPGLKSASVGVWVDVGGRHERIEQNGIAHFLEHMAFKGTKTRSSLQIAEEIEDVGGFINAYTSRENTAYYARVLQDDVPLALDVIGDILMNSTFEASDIEIERGIILQEIGQANDTPDDIIFDWLQEVAYPDQAIGRSILGPAERVSSFNREDLVKFVGEHYGPNQMILAAAGGIDHAKIVAQAEALFGHLTPVERPSSLLVPAVFGGGEMRRNKDLEQVHFVLGFESAGFHDPDYYAIAVAASTLAGGMSSRLFQEIREKRGLVYSIYGFNSSYSDGGLFGIYAGTGEEGLAELVPVLCDELIKSTSTIEEKELGRARAQMRTGIVMSLESTAARAEQISRQITVFDRVMPIEELIEKVEALSCADIERAISRLLSSDPTVAAIGPVSRLPSYDDIASRLKAA